MTEDRSDAIVSTAWLAARLADPDIRIVDSSWYLPAQKKNGKWEYERARIPGARFFDIDEIADTESGLPHTLPGAELFAERVTGLGIGNRHQVVAYDGLGIFSAARAWWMFRVFGHEKVAVLDGGIAKWRAESRPTEEGKPSPPVAADPAFQAVYNRAMFRSLEDMRANLDTRAEQVADARSRGRFDGTEPEPREGMRSGHIPGACNLPYGELIDPESGTLREPKRLQDAFARADLALDRPVVTSCGSGVTAAILSLALHLLGHDKHALYDGSWSEWGGRDDTPIEDPAMIERARSEL